MSLAKALQLMLEIILVISPEELVVAIKLKELLYASEENGFYYGRLCMINREEKMSISSCKIAGRS